MSPSNWILTNNTLYRKFTFADFSSAFAFITRVALTAEKLNHHPTWSNTWNTVEIWLSTHDAGNVITEKDQALSVEIDKLFN
jgi:4a-hydroxytetrahydrobiopterin dehydratase